MAYFLLFLIGFLSLVFFFSRRILGKRKLTSGAGLPDIKQLIGGLYEFYSPDNGETPNVEVMFFHGLQQHGDASRAHADTWISSDGSNSFYWPQKLLAAEFPRARIFSISYDSCTIKGHTSGRIDRYLVAENLLQDLTHRLGHRPHCPVILVGKDVGGLVIKNMCLMAANNWSINREKYQTFLHDIRGILYYCTPHLGFDRWPGKFDGAMFKNLGLQDENLARLSDEFNQLNRSTFKWRTRAIMGNPSTETEELCIPEGSSRDGVERCYTVSHGLHSVGRPRDRTDRTYSFLSELMSDAISEPSSSESNEFESSLLFTFDKNYVPMTNTIQDIQKSFETTNVVVLYGDSGTGKSSLARYYALCFEKNHRRSGSSPVVSYVSCGSEAVVFDIQAELLRTFNFIYSKTEFEISGVEESQSQKMARLHPIFVNHFRGLDALVILDDVWKANSNVLDKILVQGKNLRYLITTRDADLWPDSESIKIEHVTTDYGRQILANYAKFESRCIPEHLQVEADKLIQNVQAHPLALATLGAVLQYEDKFNVHQWRNVRDDLLAYMKTDRYRSVNCGESYPRSVSAALMLVVDDKFLDADALILLLAINLFQGPLISESLVQSFLRYTRPAVLKFWTAKIKLLQALGLVQVQMHTSPILSDTDGTRVYENAKNKELVQGCRNFFIHDLRQTFILEQKKDDIDEITGFLHGDREFYSLEKRSDDDWATVLCAISGVSAVRNKAQQKMGSFYRWVPNLATKYPDLEAAVSVQLSTVLENSLALLPVSTDEHNFNNEHSNSFSMSSNEVLWTFLVKRQIDFHRIALLMQEHGFIKWACSFLIDVFGSILASQLYIGESQTKMAIQICSNTLIAVLAQDISNTDYEKILLSLLGLMLHYKKQCHVQLDLMLHYKKHVQLDLHGLCDGQKCVLDTTTLLHTLTIEKSCAKDMGDRCKLSILLIGMVINTGCCACKMAVVRTPGFVDKVIELLGEDVTIDTQLVIFSTLHQIASHFGLVDENGMIIATVNSDLLLKIVPFLSPDLGKRCQLSAGLISLLAESCSWAVVIINSPGCLQKFIDLLATDVSADQQEAALQALYNIASHPGLLDEKIFATASSDLLLRITLFISPNMGRRFHLTLSLIRVLSNAHSCAAMINPSCLVKLVELLVEDISVDQQETILEILFMHVAASHFGHVSDMLGTAGSELLLLRIIPFLSQDLGKRCLYSVALVGLLATAHSCAEFIINSPSCLQRLIELLAEDVAAVEQEDVLTTLCKITSHSAVVDENGMIFATIGSDLLWRIFPFLSQDTRSKCEISAKLISLLAESCSWAVVIVNYPGYLQKFLDLLAIGVPADQQEVALYVLWRIASHSGILDENSKIFATISYDLLLRITPFISPNLGRRFQLTLSLIGVLSTAHSCAAMINPSCLVKLIELLVEDISVDQQETILAILCMAASHFELVCVMLATIGCELLLSRIIPFLSQDLGKRCLASVALIGLLAIARSCAEFIINSPSCLQRLIELLAEDVAAVEQEDVLTTLCKIASHSAVVDENGTIFAAIGSDLLWRIFPFLSQVTRSKCEISAKLISLLAGSRSWAVVIVNYPGCLQKFLDLLAIDVPANQQEVALYVLWRIASHSGILDENSKIFATISYDLLLRITPFISPNLGRRFQLTLSLIGVLSTTHSCVAMINPSCFVKLIELLVEDISVDQQETILAILFMAASHFSHVSDMLGMAGSELLLLRIIPFLSQDLGKRCLASVAIIGLLATAHSCAEFIINSPSCLQRLIELLAEDVAAVEQEDVLTTLCKITSHSAVVDENGMIFAAIGSDLLWRIFPFLSQDTRSKCEISAKLISLLAESRSWAVVIVNYPGYLEKFLDLLAIDVPADQQEVALYVLWRIASHSGILDENRKIFATISYDLLLRITPFISPNLGRRFQLTLSLIGVLSTAHSCVAMINPSCLVKLIELLVKDIPADQQEIVLATLCMAASHFELVCVMLATIGCELLLSRIMPFLSQDLGRRCQYSVALIGLLATAPSCAEYIISLPSCLQRLTELLAKDLAVVEQEDTLTTLCEITSHSAVVDENGMIFATIGYDLFLRILPFLSQDSGRRCELSVVLISNLAGAQSCIAMIINFPNCLKKLVELLAEGVAANLQGKALTALSQIASHDADVDPIVHDTFGVDVTDLERPSVRSLIEKQIKDMQNTSSNICLALYSCWFYEDTMRKAYPNAISNINKALELDPENSFLWQERGILHGFTREYLAALGDLNRALEVDIDNYECLKDRALVKFQMGDKDGACADAKRAILVRPTRVNDNSYGHNPCLGVHSVQFMHYELK